MFVTEDMIAVMAEIYGLPHRRTFAVPTPPKEYDYIRSTQKNGRNHDVTLYIFKGDQVIVNAKHFYPPGLYRAPSGGLDPGEDFLKGIRREAMEETGCEIELTRFLLRSEVYFKKNETDAIRWRSFVFLARYVSGEFEFTDKREIREVRLADWSDFEQFGRIMCESEKGGLHYRAALHAAVAELI